MLPKTEKDEMTREVLTFTELVVADAAALEKLTQELTEKVDRLRELGARTE